MSQAPPPQIQFLDEKRKVSAVITGTEYGELEYYAVYIVKVMKKSAIRTS